MNRISKTLAALALAAGTFAALAHSYTVGSIRIGHPWARATLPVQTTGGAYLKLHNTGGTPDRLVGGSTPAAERVELHSMVMDGNIMRMRELAAIDIPPGQVVELRPGALHLMLVGLKGELKIDALGAGAPAGGDMGGHHGGPKHEHKQEHKH
jgi:copper(I)-binding protein